MTHSERDPSDHGLLSRLKVATELPQYVQAGSDRGLLSHVDDVGVERPQDVGQGAPSQAPDHCQSFVEASRSERVSVVGERFGVASREGAEDIPSSVFQFVRFLSNILAGPRILERRKAERAKLHGESAQFRDILQ